MIVPLGQLERILGAELTRAAIQGALAFWE
jgi:hypothetical protein